MQTLRKKTSPCKLQGVGRREDVSGSTATNTTMVKSLVSKLSSASSNLSLASTLSSGAGQETNYAKHRNDPGRFFGDGVKFKAKLIGILEVGEARGDRMCQEALQDLKMALRAAGEHKQRITIHVTIDGLRLRDEKTGDSLYHHPVHKISFIAQDMTDSRAFGYIFGSPDSGHRFFGIKTDKAASQVVLAMRDLFQVVFELKKKEIELARQQIQSKSIHDHQLASLSSLKSMGMHNDLTGSGGVGTSSLSSILGNVSGQSGSTMSRLGIKDSKGAAKELSPESVADLVDLEQELSSIQRGITQMERITPNEPLQPHMSGGGKGVSDEDPFGDSFTNFPVKTYNLLPPPESDRSRNKTNKLAEANNAAAAATQNMGLTSLLSPAPALSSSPSTLQQHDVDDDDNWLNDLDQQPDVFDTSRTGAGVLGINVNTSLPMAPLAPSESTSTPTQQLSENSVLADVELLANAANSDAMPDMQLNAVTSKTTSVKSDAFTDLDPFGTGRTRPYIDKKYFFYELKNPPKKVLKDLSMSTAVATHAAAMGDGYASTVGTPAIDDFLNKEHNFDSTCQQQQQQQQQLLQQQQHQLTIIPTNTNDSAGISAATAAADATTDASSSHCTTTTTTTNIICTCTTYTNPININTNTIATTTITTTTTCTNAIDNATTSTSTTTPTSVRLTRTNETNMNIPTFTTSTITTTTTTITNTVETPDNCSISQGQAYQLLCPALLTSPTSVNTTTNDFHHSFNTLDGNATSSGDPVMLPRDTDPFSPTRKKSDPFQEGGDIFGKLDPFEFEFNATKPERSSPGSVSASASANTNADIRASSVPVASADVFNGPLQVSLPPETNNISPTPNAMLGNGSVSTVRSRPVPSSQLTLSATGASNIAGNAPAAPATSAFKQQTADVISSISNKKMPHLFGQSRFSKRAGDANGINMRRLQESGDSLSENEAAPEPPPRPDSASHVEPPPLPPKKQFNEIIIRPRVTSGNAVPPSTANMGISSNSSRYEYLSVSAKPPSVIASTDVPPIPLPSRRIGRSDGVYPGPGRPRKPGHTEDDYLAPIPSATYAINASGGGSAVLAGDVPPLLPPPTQISTRGRAQRQQSLSKPTSQDIYENKSEILQHQQQQQQQQQKHLAASDVDGENEESVASSATILPDITLSQLLTLGIDELAAKLNVPTSKLSTMTLVELTSYLSEFIEKSKPPFKAAILSTTPAITATTTTTAPSTSRTDEPLSISAATEHPLTSAQQSSQASVFKVNFDQKSQFVAKFDDTFGEDVPMPILGRTSAPASECADSFVANFAQFNEPPAAPTSLGSVSRIPAVPPADRYAVFREIIDQDMQQQATDVDLLGASNELGPTTNIVPSGGHVDVSESNGVLLQEAHSVAFETNFESDDLLAPPSVCAQSQLSRTNKIETNITEVVAQAKDRYAALRDIILVENLFDKRPSQAMQEVDAYMPEFAEFGEEFNDDQDMKQIMEERACSTEADRAGLVDSRGLPAEPSSSALTVQDDDDDEDEDGGAESSMDSNEKDMHHRQQDQYEQLSASNQQLDIDNKLEKMDKLDQQHQLSSSNVSVAKMKQDAKFLTVGGAGAVGSSSSGLSASKDDLEIDELMQRAISNLSLDSREHVSPAVNGSGVTGSAAVAAGNATLTGLNAAAAANADVTRLSAQTQQLQQHFSDVSTSPIPLQKSPVPSISSVNSSANIQNILLPHKSPTQLPKSPLASPIPTQLSAVSNLIDAATKQMRNAGDMLTESSELSNANTKDSWATFDSPKPDVALINEKRNARNSKVLSGKATTSLHLPPPPPPSNTSQNDTAESPCSSDPRDDAGVGWAKTSSSRQMQRSNARRWGKKECQQTSSSSRDLSPWDDETPEYQKQKRLAGLPPAPPLPSSHTDRHGSGGGYYMRHTRRMNSCDEDYGYEEEFGHRRDRETRKFKQGLSRSRDNFDLESSNWYYHGGPPHNTWSPQDMAEAARTRSFERSAYERTTYGPPIYDKRGIALPPPMPSANASAASSYDRRTAVGGGCGYDKRKYFRDYARPNYDFEEYGESPPMYREAGSFEKLGKLPGRRADYENVYDDGRSPMGYKPSRAVDYLYERERERERDRDRDRERKSFDRDSVESYDSATRRRRSFGSGDVYGSLESREDFRDRYMGGGEKTRSLRKGMKLRATGDIDYEPDSENDFHLQRSRGVAVDSRSLQRPSQLQTSSGGGGVGGGGGGGSSAGTGGCGQTRLRKSSGSSPWDGDEPPLPGQKQWKRPSSAADSERRLAESRRANAAFGQTPSGSDGEKERRFRRKQRARGKELPVAVAGARYGNYDYMTYGNNDDDDDDYVDEEEYDEPPTDEDKFERLNRRRHEMHQRMLESEQRRQHLPTASLKASAVVGAPVPGKKYHGSARVTSGDYDDEYEQTTPRSNASASASASGGSGSAQHMPIGSVSSSGNKGDGSNSKFSFDGGFESDFNQSSPPPAPVGTASSCNSTPAATVSATTTPATKSSFRFSNDFSERGDKLHGFGQNSTSVSSLQQFDIDAAPSPASHSTPPITQKLRFDDNVKISQFDDAAFEDDFSKAQFDFEKEVQWHADALHSTNNNNNSNGTTSAALKKHNLRNTKLQQRQELIKKSESINIFAKKSEDPFEDDEFFQESTTALPLSSDIDERANDVNNSTAPTAATIAGSTTSKGGSNFQWDDDSNFAKFDENM